MCQLSLPFTFALPTSELLCFHLLSHHVQADLMISVSPPAKMGYWLLKDLEEIAFIHQAVPRVCFFQWVSFLPLFCSLFCHEAVSFSPSTPWPQTGTLFACTAFLETLGGVTAVSTFNGIYSATVAWYPGFTFLLSAVLLLIPAISLW